MIKTRLLVFTFLLGFICVVEGLRHDLKIRKDARNYFFIENFGFEANGIINMEILNFKIGDSPITKANGNNVAFIITKSDTDSNAFIQPEEQCTTDIKDWIAGIAELVVYINTTTSGEYTHYQYKIPEGKGSFFNTFFVSCVDEPVSFELKLEQYNVDKNGNKNYLSAGLSPLPSLYFAFTLVYVVCLVVWIFNFVRAPGSKINRIHHLITVFIVIKLLSLLTKAIEQHFIKTKGDPEGWNIIYYIFAGLKGVMLFVLIALIGTGWSFVKPFLSDKDKKIFAIVIPLQVLDNIAMIILEETAPGSQGFINWTDIFRLVDIICCGAILIPIIWSIKHLREASQIDGKAARNMKKLKLFRQFYLLVVSYIYFTRIIVYLVDATLPYRYVWLGDFFSELATILFFSVVGFKFRPAPDNPYFSLELEDAGESISPN